MRIKKAFMKYNKQFYKISNYSNRLIIFTIIINCIVYSQFPVELNRNEITEIHSFLIENNTELLLELSAYTNTDWEIQNSESSCLSIAIDNEWESYNQDIILFSGNNLYNYKVSLGFFEAGTHTIQFKFDYNKSSQGAELIYIDSINIIDMHYTGIDTDVFLYSPILYGRDILAWNESTYTDIPLILWHEIINEGNYKIIRYSLIFSNEDSRLGIGLSDLMYSYGRTTDIEWLYEVRLNDQGEIINEKFQGPNHIDTPFEGEKINNHPILKNATLNCNFVDEGASNYKFFLSPALTLENEETRETLMDNNPWSYAIMGKELIRENSYEEFQDPLTVEISDVRNYLYIEFEGDYNNNSNSNHQLDIAIKLYGSCVKYYHDHNFIQFEGDYFGGIKRTSIEIIENFDPNEIESLIFITNNDNSGQIEITNIIKLFYLDNQYMPVDIDIDFTPFWINNYQSNFLITINENLNNVDCFGIVEGNAECDECNICNGNNIDIDDCGICFGDNEDLDCNGLCFGNALPDQCGICDGDNSSCSGCTDFNAENYNDGAIFYDGSCIYNDNIFEVPYEYSKIQDAIFYSNDGDTVLVSAGIYNENIDFLGKSILVKSLYEENDSISNFVISGIDSTSTVTFRNQTNFSGLYGFTIINGYGRGVSFEDFVSLAANQENLDSLLFNVIRGGGISIIEANPHIKDVYIANNISRNVGAGIAMVNSDPVIESAVIINNTIIDGDALGGGGIAINGGNPIIDNVEISNNYVGSNIYYLNGGGGILCGFSIDTDQLSLNLSNSKIYSNIANIGAGIGVLSGDINILKTLIAFNTGDYGSAVSMGEPLGLIVGDINMTILNSTIANNLGEITVGLINTAFLNIINSIFWDNGGEYEITNLPNNSELNVQSSFSLFESNQIGEGNIINDDPLFINDSIFNYNLQSESPAIDVGTLDSNNDGINDIIAYYGISVDIGSYEYNPLSINQNNQIFNLDYFLTKCYPNPFNPVTNISYELPIESQVTLDVYDIEGRKIITLTEGIRAAGTHSIEWNAEGSPSGVYFVKLDAGEFTQTQKLMLIK